MGHFDYTTDCSGNFADGITFYNWKSNFQRVTRKIPSDRALSILYPALRMDCHSRNIYRFHTQFVWSICCIESFVAVKKTFSFRIWPSETFLSKSLLLLLSRTRFLFGNNTLKQAAIFRKDASIGFIKFVGRQHNMLTAIVDQFNSCYSFQV